MTGYEADRYWRSLHLEGDDLRVVGYPTLPLAFNQALYENAVAAVRRTLADACVDVAGAPVLDVGCGSGFWLDVWEQLGASSTAGTDLVPQPLERLRERFPAGDFVAADLADGPPFPGREFALVSAMDVLLHITEPERWRAALTSLAAQLAPSGALVLLEPIVVAPHGRTRGQSEHNAARTLTEWNEAIAAAGLRVVALRSATHLLADPVDAQTRAGLEARVLWWRVLARTLRGHERLAATVVPPLARLDRLLAARPGAGPSRKCVVLRRAA
jgi:SAM-dependent methyltransferase